MTWLQRYRIRSFVRSSVWLPPVLGMIAGLLLLPAIQQVDRILGWQSIVGPDGARALLGALASSMLTFIVFVFSILLVAVQLASAQLTPRIIALVYRNRVLKVSLTFFVFTFTYTLAVLSRIGDTVPQVSMWVAVYSSVFCIALFIYMLDHVGKSLRPVSILTSVGTAGQEVIGDVYPQPVSGMEDTPSHVVRPHEHPARIVESRSTGAVLAFDVAGLVDLARHADSLIELVPQVGDYVTRGDPLFRVYRAGSSAISNEQLHHTVAFGAERTMEQDPRFAFRIVVDIASKALSPAINDPTTAGLALDQIHRLLRMVATQQLDTGLVHDANGQLRLLYRTPDWEDFVSLAITEIRQFGRESIQIVRRLRAMLENLIAVAPPHRVSLLRAELDLVIRGVNTDFRDPEDQVRAASADSLGVGGAT